MIFTGQPIPTPEYKKGLSEGFEMAEGYFQQELKKLAKQIKKGRLKFEATTTSTENHKCDCEFCDLR